MTGTYNGWKNYETWVTKLWMDNDYGTYEFWKEMARDNDDVHTLSNLMKDDAMKHMPELGASFYSDILTAGLEKVDWYEIAENVLAEVQEEE